MKYTDEQFLDFVKNAKNYRQVLLQLGVSPKGSNYNVLKRRIKRLSADITHFITFGKGHAWNKEIKTGYKTPLSDYLTNKVKVTSNKLRIRLLDEKIFDHKCCNCTNTDWMGLPIPLELEHIDGNSENNTLANLKMLCPNCHAQTPTYRRRKSSGQ